MRQSIPGNRRLFHCGDVAVFYLELDSDQSGSAYLRTTLGGSKAAREEYIEYTETGKPVANRDWNDYPMTKVGPARYEVKIPLVETGIFAAKCCFRQTHEHRIQWVPGDNLILKVETAENTAANTIYCAFVRQFGEEKRAAVIRAAELQKLDSAGYAAIPPSGTFRDLAGKLDFIMGELGCRIIQLLPVHPTPTVYGRMGRFGSPFAATDYFAVDPALAEFDPKATPMEQFGELVDAVHARKGRLFLDIPVNHTGWASVLQSHHPEYFVREKDRTFISPGAWGVIWADLCKLDYNNKQVHKLMAEVFLFWCGKGVDGFRCDAGYMLPPEAWRYITAKVRDQYPDVVFLLEGLGGPPQAQEELLGRAGLDWGYSELFQNYDRNQISGYFPYMNHCSHTIGELVNFAETHDNTRLAAQGATYAGMRCALSALLSTNGTFGFANGVEFLAKERIDVHEASSLNWGAAENLVIQLKRLQTILSIVPSFGAASSIELIQEGAGNVLCALRRAFDGKSRALIAVNLDPGRAQRVYYRFDRFPENEPKLLYGWGEHVIRQEGALGVIDLAPGEVLAMTASDTEFQAVEKAADRPMQEPQAVLRQRARAMALTTYVHFKGRVLPQNFDLDRYTMRMVINPLRFLLATGEKDIGVVPIRVPEDSDRMVMAAPKSILLFEGKSEFAIRINDEGRCRRLVRSCPRKNPEDGYFALVPGIHYEGEQSHSVEVQMIRFKNGIAERRTGRIMLLSPPDKVRLKLSFSGTEISRSRAALHATDLGAMSYVRAIWGALESKYDALLAMNPSKEYPADRRVMLPRCRAWVVFADYSHELDGKIIERFTYGMDNASEWDFKVPAGQGCSIRFTIRLETAKNGNAVRLRFIRRKAQGNQTLPDEQVVKLILRPDVDDRINHETTKAYAGAEHYFGSVVRQKPQGFIFAPHPHRQLYVDVNRGSFVAEPEWQYMVHLPAESYYGLEDHTDLFSPGYFQSIMKGDSEIVLFAAAVADGTPTPGDYEWPEYKPLPLDSDPESALRKGLDVYVVKRDQESTVIAGYPWFLDWGRDTLIVLRGLIAAGMFEKSAAIIRQFASFERKGTIPNMIRGKDDSNRDTSDAPLWLIVAVSDYVKAMGDDSILKENCGGRPLLEILFSIVDHYCSGTPNGIIADPESMLIFSPVHFTWMDTNHPSGTPREGYPIEIQALFFAALSFLEQYNEKYRPMTRKVKESIPRFFYRRDLRRFSDCLHCASGTPAKAAIADDHVRCNQLLALTLGAVTEFLYQNAILFSSAELVIPGAIRSLANRPVRFELPIWHNGRLLNDPKRPYWGRYNGPEDTERKASYHNGTAWAWPFPLFCEGYYRFGGEPCKERVRAILFSMRELFDSGVPGHLPEVVEGDFPHKAGGCMAQAWSDSECYRVLKLLS